MRLNPQIPPETVAALRSHYGFDQPLPVRYLQWVKAVFKGEFGFSFSYNTSVASLLWGRAGNTLLLTCTATLAAWMTAIPVGTWAAARPSAWGSQLVNGFTTTLLVIPELLFALGLLLFALRTRLFPVGGMVSPEFSELSPISKLGDLARHLFLPALALTLGIVPTLVRHVRTAMAEALASPFCTAARGHGIPRWRLFYRHALPAAGNPLISLLGLSVAALLSASLLIEVVMSWPGLGPLLLEAVLARDVYLVVGAVMFSTAFLLGGNLLSDFLLYVNDPRIREGQL